MSHWTYILLCADGTYYTGSTDDLETRLWQHREGVDPSAYTYGRRPVSLAWCNEFQTREQALQTERQIKGWSRAKKKALIREDFEQIHQIVRQERRERERRNRED